MLRIICACAGLVAFSYLSPFHTCIGFGPNPRYADCFVRAGVARRILLLFSRFIGAVGVSVVDSIKLGRVSVGEMACGSTGCLSCRGKQSTSLSLSLSWSGRSLLFSILSKDLFLQFSVAGVSVGDSIRLLQLGAAVGRGTMAVGVEYHGGLGGMGFENTMVGGVVVYLVVSERARRISTREYVEKKRRCALLKRLFEILNPGVVENK